MDLESARLEIEHQGFLFDLGQLSPDCQKQLNRQVKNGQLKRIKAYWPFIKSGTIIKSMYMKNNKGRKHDHQGQ